MIAIAAGAAFVGLFALWVILPRFILRRRGNAAPPAPSALTALPPEELAPQAAD